MPKNRSFSRALLSCTIGCALTFNMPAWAQSLADTSPQAFWRASSRLGYGPTPELAQAAAGGARAWSLAQIDAAFFASQQRARVPAALAAIESPTQEVSALFRKERDARRMERSAQASAARGANDANSPPPANLAALIGAGQEEDYSRVMAQSAIGWRLISCSNPQVENALLARMTEFWFNHFNVFLDKGSVRPYVGSYLLHAIRPHALGQFEDLLLATAQHPAMLNYLDQSQSSARGLNENYARELMELHTLGVGGGYTQADVRELARILTGWSVDPTGSAGFVFRARAHEAGVRTLMGQTFSATGQQQGIDAIRFLARNPATARRIAARVAMFFVADSPPSALVDRLAADFLQSKGSIRSLMRTLVDSPEFWDARHTLFKTPQDYACSALAAVGSEADGRSAVQNFRQTVGFLSQTGQPLLRWQTPDGYKTDAMTWLAAEALTRRADFAFSLASRASEPTFLQTFFSPAARERMSRENSAYMRSALALSGPEFMMK